MSTQPSEQWLKEMADAEDKCVSVSCGGDPSTIWDRIRWRLFPSKHCFAPEAPASWKDCVTVHSTTKLSWADRLRVLITGVVCVTCRTVTENEVGGTRTSSTCHIGTARDLLQ